MKRKLILIATIFTIAVTPIAQAQWKQTSLENKNISVLAVMGSNIFAGAPYGGGIFLSKDSGTTWNLANTGLTNTYILAIASIGTKVFTGTEGGAFLSSDSGRSRASANNGLFDSIAQQYVYVNSFAVSGPFLFAGTCCNGVFSSIDNGQNWHAVHNGLTGRRIFALYGSGSDILAGTADSGLYVSTDNGQTWASANAGLGNNTVAAITSMGTTVFVGTGTPGVFLSTDDGKNWTSDGLPSTNIKAFAVFGTNLFAGTQDGDVFLSTNRGTDWTAVNNGFTNVQVSSLALGDSMLFAGTYQSGVWRRPLSDFGISAVTPITSFKSPLTTYPNPFTNKTTITISPTESGVAEISVVNLLGEEVAHVFNGELEPGAHSFTWDATGLPAGVYECLVHQNGRTESLPMVLSK